MPLKIVGKFSYMQPGTAVLAVSNKCRVIFGVLVCEAVPSFFSGMGAAKCRLNKKNC